jgi:CIC family chloride channel protein
LSTGLAAVFLKTLVFYIHEIFTYNYQIPYQQFLKVLFPCMGILLTVYYVRRFNRGKLGRGAANILFAIARKGSLLPRDQMYSHIFSSALTVGFGGSAGLEGPIVTTGSAIGSNFARTYRFPIKDRTLLLAAGAAGGIGATFNAPIAGVLFALEVLLAEVSISSFVPILISAACGALVSKIILREELLLTFELSANFEYSDVPFFMMLGLLCGLMSVWYSRVFPRVESFFRKSNVTPYRKAFIGGIILAFLVMLFPPLFGEGYSSIKSLARLEPMELLQGSILKSYIRKPILVLLFVLLIALVKAVATGITIGSGGNGGNFAPSLLVGAATGYFFSSLVNLSGFAHLQVVHFTLVGMAGILTGIFHAPLTGIFIIAEITGGYELMIPLMMVSAMSFAMVKYLEPFSMEMRKMAAKGQIPQDKDSRLLISLRTSDFVRPVEQVYPGTPLRDLVELISKGNNDLFAVVDHRERFLGVLSINGMREVMFKPELYDTTVASELMVRPVLSVDIQDEMTAVMGKFDKTGFARLPVMEKKKFLGFISRQEVLTRYREVLKDQSPQS